MSLKTGIQKLDEMISAPSVSSGRFWLINVLLAQASAVLLSVLFRKMYCDDKDVPKTPIVLVAVFDKYMPELEPTSNLAWFSKYIDHSKDVNDVVPKLIDYVKEWQANGYTVVGLIVDRLDKSFYSEGPGDELTQVYRQLRDFTTPENIDVFTQHPLARDAERVKEFGGDYWLHDVAKGTYQSGTRRLREQVDSELYVHYQDSDNTLRILRGKHRGVEAPPQVPYVILTKEDVGGPGFSNL